MIAFSLRRTISLLACVLLLVACGSDPDADAPGGTEARFTKEGRLRFVHPDGTELASIDIEIADTDAERATGLMRRRSMGYDRGMLFVFDEVSESGMWMKNTPLPLDIIFVAPDSQVINVVERTRPFSTESILPTAPKKYVVEVRAGFVDRFGVTDSTRIRWTHL